MDKFELAQEDWRGVRAAINVARLFLKSPVDLKRDQGQVISMVMRAA